MADLAMVRSYVCPREYTSMRDMMVHMQRRYRAKYDRDALNEHIQLEARWSPEEFQLMAREEAHLIS